MEETGLTEIEVEQGDLRIRVARQITAAPAAVTYALAYTFELGLSIVTYLGAGTAR